MCLNNTSKTSATEFHLKLVMKTFGALRQYKGSTYLGMMRQGQVCSNFDILLPCNIHSCSPSAKNYHTKTSSQDNSRFAIAVTGQLVAQEAPVQIGKPESSTIGTLS